VALFPHKISDAHFTQGAPAKLQRVDLRPLGGMSTALFLNHITDVLSSRRFDETTESGPSSIGR
jgi:hypothetical protein